MSVVAAVLFLLQAGEASVNLAGKVVKVLTETSEVVVTLGLAEAEQFPNHTTKGAHALLRIPGSAAVLGHPQRWTEVKAAPAQRISIGAWYQVDAVDLSFSPAKAPEAAPAAAAEASANSSRLLGVMRLMDRVWRGSAEDEEDDDDDNEDEDGALPIRLTPASDKQPLLPELSLSGVDPGMMTNMMMMQMMQDARREAVEVREGPKAKQKRGASLRLELVVGNSGSEDGGNGASSSNDLKAATDLPRVQEGIRTMISAIVGYFEKEAARLDVVGNQTWTLRDWLRPFRLGRLGSMDRRCLLDIAVKKLIKENLGGR